MEKTTFCFALLKGENRLLIGSRVLADFVTSKSDVQLVPKRIKSQGKPTEKTAQAAAHQTPSIREQVEGNRFENKCVKKNNNPEVW